MKNVTLLLLTLISFLLYCSHGNRVYDPEKEYSVGELQDDFKKLTQILKKDHPSLQVYHNNRAYVHRDYSRDSTLAPGAEILSINGSPMTSIIDNFLETTSSDGENQTYKYAKMNRLDYGLFPGYEDFPDIYRVSFVMLENPCEREAKIEAEPQGFIASVRAKQYLQTRLFHQYDLEMVDSLKTAILKIRDFVPDRPDDYVAFLNNVFLRIRNEDVEHVIVDVRDNDGGDPGHAAELLSYLTDSPYTYFQNYVIGYRNLKRLVAPHPLNFKGDVYVLIDGGSFSTTGHFLSLMKFHDLGTLVGEEAGGSFRCYGCPKECILPHTKLRLQYMRCSYSTNAEGFTWGSGIRPDVEVKLRIEDLIVGRDTIKEHALELIKEHRKIR